MAAKNYLAEIANLHVIMDHLPLPHNRPYLPIHVPFIACPPFDGGAWQTFPQRHGWQVLEIREDTLFLLRGEKRPMSETAAFLQSWLYFGVLQSLLGDLYSIGQFVHEQASGEQRVSTENLEDILGKWTTRLSLLSKTAKFEQQLGELYSLLVEHRTMCLRMHTAGLDLGDSLVVLSVAVLGERLQAALIDVHSYCGLETPVSQAWRLRRADLPDMGSTLLDLMRARGWCPYDLLRLNAQIIEVSLLYYYSNMPPPRSSKDHGGCSEERCLAMTTDPATYRLSHSRVGCSCPLLSADEKEVARMLLAGSIPIVKITNEGPSAIPTMSIQSPVSEPFVAISHVWAEGAGNVHANALQSCLLLEISGLVNQLPGNDKQKVMPFWIDTLCVPVRPPDLQALALNKMRVPYELASSVLVVDSHLRSLQSKRLSSTELLAQISCSSWMRRLWTLQEGRLAKRIWFQFADTAVNVKDVFDNVDYTRVPSRVDFWLQTAIYVQLWMQIWYRADVVKNTSAVAGLISSTRLALSSRSVSVLTDEGLCLFCLMGMDISQITSVAPEDRMEVFWHQFDKVPIGFLFSKAPQKMAPKALHWAPSSFLGPQSEKEWLGPQDLSSPAANDPHATPTTSGLLVSLPGLKLHPDLIGRMREFDFTWNVDLIVQDESNRWFAVRFESAWAQDPISCATGQQQLAIILANNIPGHGAELKLIGQSSSIFSSQDVSRGLIVSIIESKRSITYVRGHNHVVVEYLGEGLQRYLSFAKSCAEDLDISQSTLVSETHEKLKSRYNASAQIILNNKDFRDLSEGNARHFSSKTDYDSILDDFLDTVVVTARFGDRCRVQQVASDQQWCVD